jgi:hypothetical protein
MPIQQSPPTPPKAAQTYEKPLGKMGEMAPLPDRFRYLCKNLSILKRQIQTDEIHLDNLTAENAPPDKIGQAKDRLMLNSLLLDKHRRDLQELERELLRDYCSRLLPTANQ